MQCVSEDIAAFRELVWYEGSAHYRELPWRHLDDPYLILVSEIMLQQTQVKRVLGRWERFVHTFPSIDALASAETALVLELWQGLGYNRRALALKRCADKCSRDFSGTLPTTLDGLMALPGIGPATAGGVMAFAYQKPCVYLETNVRSVFLHHFFPDADRISDRELVPLVSQACPDAQIRSWYYALLDYGAFLKTQVPNPSRRSSSYARQSPFEGSRRQKRAAIVRCVLGEPGIPRELISKRINALEQEAGRDPLEGDLLDSLLAELVDEGFFRLEGGGYRA